MLDIQVQEEKLREITRAVLRLPGMFARARKSALKSLGYNVQQELKNEGRRASRGGYLRWRPLNPHTGVLARSVGRSGMKQAVSWTRNRYATTRTFWGSGSARSGGQTGTMGTAGNVISRKSARSDPFSRMVNMVRYSVDEEDEMVMVGFQSAKPVYWRLLKQHERGFNVNVTPRMRRFFFALGFPIKAETRTLRVPPRPWVEPVERRWRPKSTPFFEEKFWDAYNRYKELK